MSISEPSEREPIRRPLWVTTARLFGAFVVGLLGLFPLGPVIVALVWGLVFGLAEPSFQKFLGVFSTSWLLLSVYMLGATTLAMRNSRWAVRLPVSALLGFGAAVVGAVILWLLWIVLVMFVLAASGR